MKTLLTILILTSIISAKTTTYCGPDSVICSYEQMYDRFIELSPTYPNKKALIFRMLESVATGPFFLSQAKYVNSIDIDSGDGVLFFHPISSVEETKVLEDTKSMKLVRRVVIEVYGGSIEGVPVESKIAYIYTIVKDDTGSWKISKVKQDAI